MKNSDLEAWVLAIIDRIANNQQVEDSRVELKAQWPDEIPKAARRIAGHANASRGQYILWIIGADENQGVVGATKNELANWYPQIEAQFDGIVPTLSTDLVVPISGKGISVVALLFEVDRPPYVVKSVNTGAVEREVPWREGTRVRSANRSDLLKILVEQQSIPQIDILTSEVTLETNKQWHVKTSVYVISHIGQTLIIPFHRCNIRLEFPTEAIQIELTQGIHLRAPKRYHSDFHVEESVSLTINGTPTELVITGPGEFTLVARSQNLLLPSDSELLLGKPLNLHASLPVALTDIHVPLSVSMVWVEQDYTGSILGHWRLKK